MTRWTKPPGFAGDIDLLRTSISDVRVNDRVCPAFLAAKSRPAVWPQDRGSGRWLGLELFAVGAVNDVLDVVEFQNEKSVDQALVLVQGATRNRMHGGLQAWVRHAVQQWQAAGEEIAWISGLALRPAERKWVVQGTSPDDAGRPVVKEISAWARRYCSADGRIQELRLLRTRSVRDRVPDAAQVVVAAFVAARGRPTSRWTTADTPHRVDDRATVRHVRVVEVGCEDGSSNVLFDGSAEQAVRNYLDMDCGQRRVREVLNGTAYRPGDSCQKCKLITVCPEVPSVPGLLGITTPRNPRRTWSITDGRRYERCPAREHLRRLKLPTSFDIEYGMAARRGQAVHAWIEQKHKREPLTPCATGDVPDTPDEWGIGIWHVAGRHARLGAQMIGDHAMVCPIRGLAPDAPVRVEPTVAVYDPDANVVIIAKPDLVYRSDGTWVLRELKTTRQTDEGDLIERYPQIALGLLLLRHGVLGDGPAASRVELERLTPEGPLVTVFEPSDEDLVDQARHRVHGLVAAWHRDMRAQAHPGEWCGTCEVARWCPDAAPAHSSGVSS